ncbi:MAG TPA: hypothetical protein VGK59_18650 [Ohtaekwangia sp.]
MAKKKQKLGRKKINPKEKAVLVGFYAKQSIIDGLGGMARVREIAKDAIDFRYDQEVLVGMDAAHG